MKRTPTENKDGLRFPKSVLKFTQDKSKHTTQKPVALCEWLIKTYTNEGDLVLDNTFWQWNDSRCLQEHK